MQLLSLLEESSVSKDNNVLVLDELEKQNKQLQTMVSRYKRIISDTVSDTTYLFFSQSNTILTSVTILL